MLHSKVRSLWLPAVDNLKRWKNQMQWGQKFGTDQVNQTVFDHLKVLPWSGPLCGFTESNNFHYLSVFATKEWLTDYQINLMLDVLHQELLMVQREERVEIVNAFFFMLLQSIHKSHIGV